MGHNPIQDWVAGRDNEPGPEEELLLPAWLRSADPKGNDGKIGSASSRNGDVKHGRGYVLDSEDDRRTSDDGLVEAAMAALIGAWIMLPGVRLIRKCAFYLVLIFLLLWIVP